MDNMDESEEGRPTEPIGWNGPSGSPRQAPGAQPPRRGPGRLRRLGIGIAAAAVLAGGGAVAGVALAGPPSAAAAPAGQAGALSAVLSNASSPAGDSLTAASPATPGSAAIAACRKAAQELRSSGHPRAARLVRAACRGRLGRLRVLGGLHGQFTFTTRNGVRTLAFERGVVESASSSAVVVRAADGTTWTWDLVSNSVIREGGQRTDSGALAVGQRVFVGGPVISGASDARLIVIAAPAAAGSPAA